MPSLGVRASGVLLHPTSLPGPHGCGDLGRAARRFLEFLVAAKQRWWQMLPVGPAGFGNSPYSSLSSFAGNPLLIPLDEEEGPALPTRRVDYEATAAFRERCLRAKFEAERRTLARDPELAAFREQNRAWLPDFTLFAALKRAHGGGAWTGWPRELRARRPDALAEARRTFADEIAFDEWAQWQFDRAFSRLRADCEARGVALIGDVPIFVAHDSADVWARPELWHLDADGQPTVVAGVPPDYFSATGQRWGNPLYRWDRLREDGYAWWIARLQKTLARFHAVRLDHFIGFQRYWEIDANCPTAVDGHWKPGPGAELFSTLRRALGQLPLIAEDLGAITPEVKALRDQFELPGIKILQFAFGTDPSAPDFKPHNYPRHAVVYTGTHDNDTTVGWFEERGGAGSTRTPAQAEKERRDTLDYLGYDGREIHWAMIRAVLASVADLAIVPMQDLLGLGSEARMNLPGTVVGNWEWRVTDGELTPELASRLGALTGIYER